jgi:hypothetical protein
MTQILTFRWANSSSDVISTSSKIALLPVTTTTATACISFSDKGDDYSDDAVARILKAKNAKAVVAPDDADAFMSWLTK